MSCHRPRIAKQRGKTPNTIALPLWLPGISTRVVFDNNQMTGGCPSDVQPRQTVSVKTDTSVLLASK